MAMRLSLAICMAFLSSGATAEPNQAITVQKRVIGTGVAKIRIIAKADQVIVNFVSANRGNCQVGGAYVLSGQSVQTTFPMTLKFGDELIADTLCDPIELQVGTDRGIVTVPLDQ